MKSQAAEREAAAQVSRPRVEVRIVPAEYINEPNHRRMSEVALERHLNDSWQIQACAADASGTNLIYTLIRAVPVVRPAPAPIAVR